MTKKHTGSGRRVVAVSAGNYMANAIGIAESQYSLTIQRETFGHLYPEVEKSYSGFILMTFTCWGYASPIDCKFKNLDMSPELFDHINEFIQSEQKDSREGQVWRFDGKYIKFKDGTCEFKGKFRKINTD
jgi:transcriptional regulator GlxA family with amidase domain